MCMSSNILLNIHSRSCHDNFSSAILLESQNSVVLIRSVGQRETVYFLLSNDSQTEKEEVELSVIRPSDMSCRCGVPWGDLFSRKLLFQRFLLVQGQALPHCTLWCANFKLPTSNCQLFFFLVFGSYETFSILKRFKHGPNSHDLIMRSIVLEKIQHCHQNIPLVVWRNISRTKQFIISIKIMTQNFISVEVLQWWQRFVRCSSSTVSQRRRYFLNSIN